MREPSAALTCHPPLCTACNTAISYTRLLGYNTFVNWQFSEDSEGEDEDGGDVEEGRGEEEEEEEDEEDDEEDDEPEHNFFNLLLAKLLYFHEASSKAVRWVKKLT